MHLKRLSAFQIFPNKALEIMKNCTKIRNELLAEIYEKHKVGNGAEEIASSVENIVRPGLGSIFNIIASPEASREPGT